MLLGEQAQVSWTDTDIVTGGLFQPRVFDSIAQVLVR